MDKTKLKPIGIETEVDVFLDRAVSEMGNSDLADLPMVKSAGHRVLRVLVSDDRLEATLEAVFPDTTLEEVEDALIQANIRWGKNVEKIRLALQKAKDSGRLQRNVQVAQGKPAEFTKRKEINYPFLNGLKIPDSEEPLHLASSILRKISEITSFTDVEHLRAYALPVVAVRPGTVLMEVRGEDEIEPGRDVFGKEIKTVFEDDGVWTFHGGDGVEMLEDGSLRATCFGYVATSKRDLNVVMPIWVSPDHMEAYYFNPPILNGNFTPTVETINTLLSQLAICFGIEEAAIASMCKDLSEGNLRESCVRLARGKRPTLSKGQMSFKFDVLPPVRFERFQNLLQGKSEPDISLIEDEIQAVSEGQLLAEQVSEDGESGKGRDLFGCPVAMPEDVGVRRKNYKAGKNVRREVRDGQVVYISETYGYPGVLDDKIMVLSPIWLAPNRMVAYFVALSQSQIWPTQDEMVKLLECAHIRYGVQDKVVADLQTHLDDLTLLGCVAKGDVPEPGKDGTVELLFKQTMDPGKLGEGGTIDYREREGVPQARPKDLLARRSFPTSGKSGRDVRGRLIPPPKSERGILYAGHHVVLEEGDDGEQLFYATGMGHPRVVKDTLSVLQLYRQPGDVDYRVGNIKMEGDVAIEGSIKNRFKVEATGDVYVEGGVDRRAQIIAGGNVIVKRGIVGADVHTKGSLSARFIQESKVCVEQNLIVRNYISDSRVVVYGKALIQGDDGGQRQLCLLGGDLFAGENIDVASLGSPYGRPTRVMTGINLEIEKQCERYKKGLAFCDLQMRRVMRSLGGVDVSKLSTMLQNMSPNRKKFMLKNMHDLRELKKLRESLAHYLDTFKDQQQKFSAQAFVRVHLSAFQKVSLQIKDRHLTLTEDIQKTLFRLNAAHDVIVREKIV